MIRSYKGIRPAIPASCYVDDSAQIIGDVVLGEHASVWMNAVLRGDVHSIRVGAHSNVQDCSVLHGMKEQYGVFVGEYVTVGHSVCLLYTSRISPRKFSLRCTGRCSRMTSSAAHS